MLKHATPRSSPSFTNSFQEEDPSKNTSNAVGSSLRESGGISCTDGKGNEKESSESISKLRRQSESALSDGKKPLPPPCSRSQPYYNERGVDCDGIITPPASIKKEASSGGGLKLGEKILSLGNLSSSGSGIGPVITHGKAIVRRGLSFNTKREVDSDSVRSVKSEGLKSNTNDLKAESILTKANSVMALQTKTQEKEVNSSKKEGVKQDGTHSPDQDSSKDSKVSKHPNNSKTTSKKIFGISKHDHPSLKSLLRLPGVYGHIPVPESAPFGTPHILSPDSLSLNSSVSFISSNSGRTSSRSWSSNASSNSNNTSDSSLSNCSSTSEPTSTTLKIFAKCLRSDIEYKTVSVGSKVSSRQLINLLLSKARMRHRDPNLFYLTMEVTVRRWSGVPVRALLVLEDSARPAQLALCRPSGDLKFVLQMRMGGIIKIHDTVLMPGSQYKSLLISYRTTAEESVQLLLNCYGRRESKHYYALHEVCQSPTYKDRRLGQSEKPLEVKAEWPRDRRAEFVFVLRRNMTQALSLRKLAQRTADNRMTLREERSLRNNLPTEARTGQIKSKDTQEVEETVIDCTRTTPVMMTLIREETEPQNPVNNNNNNKKEVRQDNINGNRENKALSIIKEKNEFQMSTSFNPNTNRGPTDGQQSRSIRQFNDPVDREIKEKDLMFDVNKPFSFYRKIEIDDEEKNSHPEDRNSQEISNSFSQRWQNSSYRITFHSLPNEQELRKLKPRLSSSRPDVKEPFESYESRLSSDYIPTQDSRSCRTNPFPRKEFRKEENGRKTSSAVQTELTCIPLKGLKQRQKWNSVETLLGNHYPRSRKEVFARHQTKENGVSGNENTNFESVCSFGTSVERHHHPGRTCNCQKCFYI